VIKSYSFHLSLGFLVFQSRVVLTSMDDCRGLYRLRHRIEYLCRAYAQGATRLRGCLFDWSDCISSPVEVVAEASVIK